MDRRDVVRWLRSNPEVDVTALANEAKAEWPCTVKCGRAIDARDSHMYAGQVRIAIYDNAGKTAQTFLKPDDAAAFARHILELVKDT